MHSSAHRRSFTRMSRRLALAALLLSGISAFAQIPLLNTGAADSGFAQIDFAQIYLDQMNRNMREGEAQREQNKKLVGSGVVSALDLAAPGKAVEEFNRASSLLKAQDSKEAIKHLQKAIHAYPKFVSAHVALGLACLDQDDKVRAKAEFETATNLDPQFPGSVLNLGLLALSDKDYAAAQTDLEKAASLAPKNARILEDLAYAQNGNHQYQQVLETAKREHTLDHKGMANVHYIAASAALSLHNFDAMQRELTLFLAEDPTNAFAPIARKNLAALVPNRRGTAGTGSGIKPTNVAITTRSQTFPNSDRLKAQLNELGDESQADTCNDCGTLTAAADAPMAGGMSGADVGGLATRSADAWTLHASVDQVALFFSVSNHGHSVSDLQLSDIQLRDDGKPPAQVMQFAPQSKLPLRLALLIDTSGSVHDRFTFEKRAAAKFVQKLLNPASDLGFVAGFSLHPIVTQDFSSDPSALGQGIDKLTEGGGTAIFDAVSFSCWKLAEYPESERVAKVVVVLSDGEDNSSHSSLKQSILAAERTGVTIYTVSTREERGPKTDADKMLEAIAERTGGEAMFPGDMFTLDKSLDKLRDLIRSRYFIAYKPADFQPNGSFRAISIVAEKNGKHLQGRARKGYRARLETSPN